MRAVCVIAVSLALAAPASAAELRLKRVGTFSEPVYVTSPPRDGGTLAVVERYGRVRLVASRARCCGGCSLDLRGRVRITHPRRDRGPARAVLARLRPATMRRSRRLYVDYVDGRGRLRVDEFQRGEACAACSTSAARRRKHHGGQLQFGPDGLLYVSTGMGDDAGSSARIRLAEGKLLRLDPRGDPPGPRSYALGLRNPWRFSFDRASGALLIGDVGEQTRPRRSMSLAAGRRRGAELRLAGLRGATAPRPATRAVRAARPRSCYRHGRGWCSVVGGYVVRGRAPRALRGRYVYGDVCSGRMWSAASTATALERRTPLRAPRRLPRLVRRGRARAAVRRQFRKAALWRLVDRRS